MSSNFKKSDHVGRKSAIVRPKFPPNLTIDELMNNALQKLRSNKLSKVPNAFLAYRMAVQKECNAKKYHPTMSDLSLMTTKLWVREPEHVRAKYNQMVAEAKLAFAKIRDGIFPRKFVEYHHEISNSIHSTTPSSIDSNSSNKTASLKKDQNFIQMNRKNSSKTSEQISPDPIMPITQVAKVHTELGSDSNYGNTSYISVTNPFETFSQNQQTKSDTQFFTPNLSYDELDMNPCFSQNGDENLQGSYSYDEQIFNQNIGNENLVIPKFIGQKISENLYRGTDLGYEVTIDEGKQAHFHLVHKIFSLEKQVHILLDEVEKQFRNQCYYDSQNFFAFPESLLI
ncbi:hypothetical protein G9A89_010924 [Geosiphon pyriformis]|nr:hypothetical protein G9A89_010924 [Geosiphon pyriformis]